MNKELTVYVHCTAGMNRAAATVIAYLSMYQGMSVAESYDYVKSHRTIASPNFHLLSSVLAN